MPKEQEAIDLILRYGSNDGAHHKQWVLSQVLKILMGEDAYKKFIEEDPTHGEYGEWDEGIPP